MTGAILQREALSPKASKIARLAAHAHIASTM